MPDPLVETRYGRLRGTVEDGLVVFKGVPFAAPPTGPLRLRSPKPPEPWPGVRDATAFGPVAPQPGPLPGETFAGDPTDQSEDCLYLNLWTPALDDAERPVMVWIHGGGFVTGSGGVGVYRGEHLARRGAVVVTINYRLGALGFLSHPNLADEHGGFGNWGLADQAAALCWVRDHIRAFGGNPDNVTIFGESAGAISVAALLASPITRGLFRRAVVQSGAAVAVGVGSAARLAEVVAAELGLPEVSLETMQAVPVADLLAAQRRVLAEYEALGLPFQPVVDGRMLDRHPAAAIASGAAVGIDLLVGTNRDEWKFFTISNPKLAAIDDARVVRLMAAQLGAAGLSEAIRSDEFVDVVRRARLARGDSVQPAELYSAVSTDWIFRVPSMRLAEAQARVQRTYAYLFDWETPFGGGILGSCHALEIPFVFGTVRNAAISVFCGSGPDAELLSEKMQAAWVAFARSGDPSSEPLGAWPGYGPERLTMRLGRRTEVTEAPMETERAWLDASLGPYGELEAAGLERVRLPPGREAEAVPGT